MAETKTIEPVFAQHRVTYGKGQSAPPRSIFTPTTAEERAELFEKGAVRELTDNEAKLLAADPATASDSTGSTGKTKPKGGKPGDETKTGDAGSGADESPLG